jgi:hypothetical protein
MNQKKLIQKQILYNKKIYLLYYLKRSNTLEFQWNSYFLMYIIIITHNLNPWNPSETVAFLECSSFLITSNHKHRLISHKQMFKKCLLQFLTIPNAWNQFGTVIFMLLIIILTHNFKSSKIIWRSFLSGMFIVIITRKLWNQCNLQLFSRVIIVTYIQSSTKSLNNSCFQNTFHYYHLQFQQQ